MICTGAGVLKLVRRMREPVTTNSSTSVEGGGFFALAAVDVSVVVSLDCAKAALLTEIALTSDNAMASSHVLRFRTIQIPLNAARFPIAAAAPVPSKVET